MATKGHNNLQLKLQVKKCFKCLGYGHIASNCPSKRNMMMHDGVVLSDHSSQRSKSPNTSRCSSENESEIPCEGDLLVVRRMLGQVLKPFDESQRENIFYTRCLINDKLCSLTVDRGSCANVASTRVVDKPSLSTISHAKPYKLQWLSEEGEIIVNKQILISFSIDKYKDEVLCDVVPMEATHILLGRPWQFDRKTIHDGLTTKITFNFHGHKVTLKSLSPKEVHEDQLKMKEKREIEKEKKNSKRSLLISHQEVKKVMFSQKNMLIAISRTLESELVLDSPHCLANLVKEFNYVFQDPLKRITSSKGH